MPNIHPYTYIYLYNSDDLGHNRIILLLNPLHKPKPNPIIAPGRREHPNIDEKSKPTTLTIVLIPITSA